MYFPFPPIPARGSNRVCQCLSSTTFFPTRSKTVCPALSTTSSLPIREPSFHHNRRVLSLNSLFLIVRPCNLRPSFHPAPGFFLHRQKPLRSLSQKPPRHSHETFVNTNLLPPKRTLTEPCCARRPRTITSCSPQRRVHILSSADSILWASPGNRQQQPGPTLTARASPSQQKRQGARLPRIQRPQLPLGRPPPPPCRTATGCP